MGIEMKTISRSQRPLTYGDLDIGDIFRGCNGDTLFIRTIATYKRYNAKFLDENERYNAVSLSSGHHYWFDDEHKVEKYNKEIEIAIDPKQDFVSWI